ncbi:MAG TPA: adenylate/guanylate cyclase domain-containing protein [Acidimicrobiia bacterium]|nr:adenylate/guanylate cyclase domain-containing protein [Acidimicrobiia bacterium]
MPELPTGTVTFLFTDLEGSTRLWEQHPEAMQAALARHDAILRDAVEHAGGHVIKTTGDGVHAVFATADAGLRAAVAGQRGLTDEPWTATGPLRVRMGVHTGAAEQREGDYYGPTLNRAARMMSVAHGGQMVVSQATATVVADELDHELRLEDLGEQRLRDLDRPERVYQVVAPGLPDAFPPLRSVDTLPSNLPAQLTSFVGRTAEMAGIRERLRRERLVTIVGVGGVGKTRLALEVAGELPAEFRDGAWLCELAAAGDAEAMVDSVAAALRVIDRPATTRRQSLVDFLTTREALVILDNCEHLLDEVATLITDVLARAPGVRILATSREPLGVAGEQVWALRSLPIPTSADDALVTTDAVRLFVERAQAGRAGFALDDGNAAAVAEICRRLDGIPLAIELAAARAFVMQPGEIAEHLDERFRLLSAGRRASVDRHQTLRATVDWSYSLMTELERTVFARLSVFPSTFDAEAAVAVAGGDGLETWDVLDATTSLVTKSMLAVEDDAGGPTTRFGMLETLRQYGRDRLAEAGEPAVEARRQRHSAHYAAVAVELDSGLTGHDDVAARRRVVLEIDNLRAAMAWSLERPDEQLAGVSIAAHLALLVSTFRSLGLGAWVERAVPAARGAPSGLRFTVIGTAAFSAIMRGDAAATTQFLEETFEAGVPDDALHYSPAYTALSLASLATDLNETVAVSREGLERSERSGHAFGAVSMRGQVGVFAALAGDPETGHRETGQALVEARRLGNASALALSLYLWAAAWWMDEPLRALEALEESAALTRGGASDVVYADTLELLSRLRADDGDLSGSLRAIQAALRETFASGNRLSLTSHAWYLAESLGRLQAHLEIAAVAAGICISDELAPYAPQLGGRERDVHEQSVAATRAALGDEAYDALVAQGQAMGFDDVVTYLSDTLERLVTAS